ncbi:MAG: radical SAM protein [Desulfobacteraceae bacterium]|nr:radical SAM protein [Desulfobacteraceae bacterium]
MKERTVAFSKNSSNLFFHILTKCNLSCKHCYINKEQHGDNTLDIETIKSWLDLFSKKSKEMNIIFLGGEPTLHPDLSFAVKHAKQTGFKSVTIDTNGYLLHNILDKITCDEVDFISFSLDGATKETNDSIRGQGSYDQCLAGITKAVSKGFSTSMIYTVSEDNIDELSMMPGLVKNLNIKRFFIQVIGIRGESSRPSSSSPQVSKEKWLDNVPKIAEQIAQLGIIVNYPKVFLDCDEKFECAALVSDNFFIFPNGRVYQCPVCEDFPMHSFEIKNNQLIKTKKINEKDLFSLSIPEGCVMNKLIQPDNLSYNKKGDPEYKVACCMLKQEVSIYSEKKS